MCYLLAMNELLLDTIFFLCVMYHSLYLMVLMNIILVKVYFCKRYQKQISILREPS